jgi:Plasmid pRiA4b ORF-3-like protein
MARKKSSPRGDLKPPGMTDAAGMLATFAAGVLGQPESRAHEVSLKLSPSERAIVVGVPGLDVRLKERLNIPSAATRSFPFTMDELARICLALSEALLDAEGRDAVKLLKVTGQVTDLLNQAIAEVRKPSKSGRASPKAKETKPKTKPAGESYQLKVTLKDIKPPIWRRLLVSDCSLTRLHEVLQVAMGWENYHLYSFEVGGTSYTDPRGAADLDMEDAGRAKLSEVLLKEKAKLRYTYDFGDNWEHEVVVEKILPPGEGPKNPGCLDGKRACPPEDVGGPWGYQDFLEAISDPGHEQHEELMEWSGGDFDPEAFDLQAVNKGLRRLKERA